MQSENAQVPFLMRSSDNSLHKFNSITTVEKVRRKGDQKVGDEDRERGRCKKTHG